MPQATSSTQLLQYQRQLLVMCPVVDVATPKTELFQGPSRHVSVQAKHSTDEVTWTNLCLSCNLWYSLVIFTLLSPLVVEFQTICLLRLIRCKAEATKFSVERKSPRTRGSPHAKDSCGSPSTHKIPRPITACSQWLSKSQHFLNRKKMCWEVGDQGYQFTTSASTEVMFLQKPTIAWFRLWLVKP